MPTTGGNVLMTIGNYAADLYDSATGADKATYMAEAKAAYEALAKDPGTKYADAARTRPGAARAVERRHDGDSRRRTPISSRTRARSRTRR